MEKIIKINHHFDDYECMYNGIEDLYMEKTNEKLPSNFFFALSGFGEFCYLKTDKSYYKRMVCFGDGRTKQMYEKLSPIVGFDYKFIVNKDFENALKNAKKEINNNHIVILGGVDMYYLHYFTKIYHQEHIPLHYVTMIGYSDEKNCIYVNDCGRKEIMMIPNEELKQAWDCEYPGLCKPYTLCKIRMNSNKDKLTIAKEAFLKQVDNFLYPKANIVGYKGFEKFIKEFPDFEKEIGKEEYDKFLKNMIYFFGTVPTIPNKLKGIKEDDFMNFYGSMDKIALILDEMGKEYNISKWVEAGTVFKSGCKKFEKITYIIVDYLVKEKDEMNQLTTLFKDILEIMKKGYKLIEEGIR